MALGLKYGQYKTGDMESRLKADSVTERFLDEFKEENGSYICNELLNCDISTKQGRSYAIENRLFTEFCPKMVRSAAKIAEKLLDDEPNV